MQTAYHSGERIVQQLAGEEQMAQRNGRIIKEKIVRGAFNFIENQPLVIISSADQEGNVWTSALIGSIGYVKVRDESSLTLDLGGLQSPAEDVFFQNLEQNPQVGLLFIEPASRRRYRVNGLANKGDKFLTIEVKEAYPNCPKYIQKRVVSFSEKDQNSGAMEIIGETLTGLEKNWIRGADTFFVGSVGPDGRLDASHRGGKKGFVEILPDDTLKIPDYAGNSMYNTLGNFHQTPNAGLLFIDFKKGQTLQLTGEASLLFDQKSTPDMEKTAGTGRYWLFRTKQWIRLEQHHAANWEFIEASPFNP